MKRIQTPRNNSSDHDKYSILKHYYYLPNNCFSSCYKSYIQNLHRTHPLHSSQSKLPLNRMPPEMAETEAERQLQQLLKRQMETNYTIHTQFEQHRDFKSAKSYSPLTAEIAGTLTADEFSKRAKIKDRTEKLRLDGLDEEEIQLKMHLEGFKVPCGHFGMEPSILSSKTEEISAKIKEQSETTTVPTLFRGAKGLTRHEMEIEKSLKPNSTTTKYLGMLVTDKETANSHRDHPINYLKEMEEKLMQNVNAIARSRRKRRKKAQSDVLMDVTPCEISTAPELTWDDIISIADKEIMANRLSMEEITLIPRFQNYAPGNASKTLFVKNLSAKVDRYTLMSLFKKYQHVIDEIRLMRGKMKGQAFVKFQAADRAEDALHFLNGYNLKGKPVVIQFGLNCT